MMHQDTQVGVQFLDAVSPHKRKKDSTLESPEAVYCYVPSPIYQEAEEHTDSEDERQSEGERGA